MNARVARRLVRLLLAAGAVVLGAVAANAQQDCPRGELDRRFCDRNGDLVADPPADGKFVNPPR